MGRDIRQRDIKAVGSVIEAIGFPVGLGEKLKVVKFTATMLELPSATPGDPPVMVMAPGMSVMPPVAGLLGPNGLALTTMGSALHW